METIVMVTINTHKCLQIKTAVSFGDKIDFFTWNYPINCSIVSIKTQKKAAGAGLSNILMMSVLKQQLFFFIPRKNIEEATTIYTYQKKEKKIHVQIQGQFQRYPTVDIIRAVKVYNYNSIT